jgi:hypothetical protein
LSSKHKRSVCVIPAKAGIQYRQEDETMINPGWDMLRVLLIAAIGIGLGRLCSRGGRTALCLGYCLPLATLILLTLGRCGIFGSPNGWLGGVFFGQPRFLVLSLVIPAGLMTLLPFLPRRVERIAVTLVLVGFIACFSIYPVLAPALIRDGLLRTPNHTDPLGVCLQTRPYTCGPAAAVSALHELGLQGHEGRIAAWASSAPVIGTLPWDLCNALDRQYGPQGLRCEFRRFDTLDELKSAGLTLAMVRGGTLTNHCVAVLAIDDRQVILADPSLGRLHMPLDQFAAEWRHTGITLRRDGTSDI